MIKIILILFLINNVFLFIRTFKTSFSNDNKKTLDINLDYYKDKEINELIFFRRISKLLLRKKSLLSKLLIYYMFLFPIFFVSEVMMCILILLSKFNSSLLSGGLIIFIVMINFLFFYNKNSISRDRILLVLRMLILSFLCF